jgi:hypothetical protein
MPHNSTIIICKDPPIEAEAIIVRIKSMKEQVKRCVGCRGYRTKITGMQNLTREDLVVDDK